MCVTDVDGGGVGGGGEVIDIGSDGDDIGSQSGDSQSAAVDGVGVECQGGGADGLAGVECRTDADGEGAALLAPPAIPATDPA